MGYRPEVFISSCVTVLTGSAAGTAEGDLPPLRDGSGEPACETVSAASSALSLGGTADGLGGVTKFGDADGVKPRLAACSAFMAFILAAIEPIFGSDVGVLRSILGRSLLGDAAGECAGVEGIKGTGGALSPIIGREWVGIDAQPCTMTGKATLLF